MKTMKKRRKVTFILLLTVIALAGVILYLRTLNREEIKERPDSTPLIQEEVSAPEEATEPQDVEAESESEQEKVDLQVKVGESEYPVIFEDGNYKNLDKVELIWTVNNLFESSHNFEIIEDGNSYKFYIDGREVESKLYLEEPDRRFGPDIRGSYFHIIEEEGVHHLVWSREFIEAYTEASSKYGELTDELNAFIDRLNQVKSAEIDNLTEAEIDSMWLIDPSYEHTGVELKRRGLILRGEEIHYQSTNVFWIEESAFLGRHIYGEDAEPMLLGQAIRYKRKDNLPSWVPEDKINIELPPPSNFNPRLHTDPDKEPFIWVPTGTESFVYDNGQWKIAVIKPGT